MQYDHEGVGITLPVYAFSTQSIDNGIDQRKLHHRTSYRFGHGRRLNLTYQIILNNRKICRNVACGPHYTYCNEQSNSKPYGLQDNYTKLKLEYAYNGKSFKFQLEAQFSSIVELNLSISAQVQIQVYQLQNKQHSDTRYRCTVLAADVRRTDRYQSMLSSQTDIAGNLDVSTSSIGAICESIASCNGNTSIDVTNNQTENTTKFLLTTLWYNPRY